MIESKVPPQPWEKGMALSLSKELNLPLGIVRQAVDTLIEQGKYKLQKDGKLYDLIKVE
ncbi:hypothetical protein D3C72_2590030 [compost metagenome]